MVETWEVLAMVAPLYISLGGILWRMGILRRWTGDVETNEDDISSNEDRIRDIQQKVNELDRRMEMLEYDHRMVHDLLADENFCGSDNCRFCDREDEEER